ncbi:MAG TPA: hypothetical protein VKE93_03320 [Candidatus Angelobacter sp.]|nr:hypothetical protein [Candidatus Angelobacter sp.]
MTKKRFVSLVFLFVSLVTRVLWGQIDTERVPPALDNDDLYTRLAASRLVVIGGLAKSEGITKRLTPEIRAQMITNISAGTGGGLYTIQTEETVCRQSDFDANAPVVTDQPQSLSLFIPFSESYHIDGHTRELFVPGQRYLLFLVELDDKQKNELTEIYNLDPNRPYYRAKERNRGVIPLSRPTAQDPVPKQPKVLDRIVQLCNAMRSSSPAEKLESLQRLIDSDDPVLQREARIAKAAVKASMSTSENQQQQPKHEP